jgi:hypothetical protein
MDSYAPQRHSVHGDFNKGGRRNFSAKEVSPQGHRAHGDFNKGDEKEFHCKGGFNTGTQSAQKFKNVGEKKEFFIGFRSMALRRRG